MKSLITLITIVCSIFIYSQSIPFENNPEITSTLFRNKVNDGAKEAYSIQGTPYIYKDFIKSKIGIYSDVVLTRYNANKDEIEFKKVDETYILPKLENYSSVFLIETNEKIELHDYTIKNQKENGYLFKLYSNNNIILYKKVTIAFNRGYEAKSSYDEAKPARYEPAKELFLIDKGDNQIIEFPKNKKKLIELFPEKKEDIETFLSKNTISFTNTSDIIRLLKVL